MAYFPVNTLVFSGYGDDALFRFLSPDGTDLGQPPGQPTFGPSGSCLGLNAFADGSIFMNGFPAPGFDGPAKFPCDFTALTIGSPVAGGSGSGATDGLGNAYYLLRSGGNTLVKKMTSAGVTSTVATVANVSANGYESIGVNQAGTIAYVMDDVRLAAATITVKKVDLIGGTSSTFVTATVGSGGGYTAGYALLVMPDDSVIVPWGSRCDQVYPMRYSAAGALLTTYDSFTDWGTYPTSPVAVPTWLTHAYQAAGSGARAIDPDYFFIGYYSSLGAPSSSSGCVVAKLATATGAVVSSFVPDDGAFEFDSAFTALRLSIGLSPEVDFTPDDDGTVSHPLGWLELTDRADAQRTYAEVDLNDRASYYGGYKAPLVLQFQPITRGLSDRTGQLQHLAFGAVLSDTAREFRGLLGDPSTKYLTNRPLVERIIDDEDRRLELTPRLVANGYVSDYSPEPDLKFRITGSDWLKKKFSRKRRAQTAWQPRILKEDFPDCPKETLNLPAPVIYGAIGLSGATGVTGVAITPIARPAAPSSFTATPTTGGVNGGGFTSFYALTAIVGGIESDPAYADATTDSVNNAVNLAWTNYPSATSFRLYQAVRSDFMQFADLTAGLAGGTTSYTDTVVPPNQNSEWIDGTAWRGGLRMNVTYYVFAQLSATAWSQPGTASMVVTPISEAQRRRDVTLDWDAYPDAIGYRVLRHVSFYSNWGPRFDVQVDVSAATLTWDDIGNDDNLIDGGYAPPTGLEAPGGAEVILPLTGSVKAHWVGSEVISGTRWKRLLVARHACKRIGRIDYSHSEQGSDTAYAGQQVFTRATGYGTSWLSPDEGGWPFADRYVDINGRRYTLVYTTLEPLPSTILVDVDGIEDAGDGTGALITAIHQQHLHWLTNFVAPDTPYAAGAWLGATYFPHLPTLPLIDAASFAAVEAAAGDRLAGGYEGAQVIGANGEEVGVLDQNARFCVSGDHEVFPNRKGQLAATSEPIAPPSGLTPLTDVLSIVEGSFRITDEVTTAFFNVLPVRHTRDYTGLSTQGWASDDRGEPPVRDDLSVEMYDQEIEAPTVYEFHGLRATTTQGRATIADVEGRVLARFRDPRRKATLTVPLSGSNYDCGDVVPISAVEGVGADGWSNHHVRVDQHQLRITEGQVSLDCYDMEPAYTGAFILGDRDTLAAEWLSASFTERRYGFLCDRSTGKFSDGSIGKALR